MELGINFYLRLIHIVKKLRFILFFLLLILAGFKGLPASKPSLQNNRDDIGNAIRGRLQNQSSYGYQNNNLIDQPVSNDSEKATEKRHKKTRISKAITPELYVLVKKFRYYKKPYYNFSSGYPVQENKIGFSLRGPPSANC